MSFLSFFDNPRFPLFHLRQGLKLMPEGHPEQAAIHSNRATCFLHLKQYADVVNETSQALKLNPSYSRALINRCRAFMETNNVAKAKKDANQVLKNEPGNEDAKAPS